MCQVCGQLCPQLWLWHEQSVWPWLWFGWEWPSIWKRVETVVGQGRHTERNMLLRVDPEASGLKSLGRALCISAFWSKCKAKTKDPSSDKRKNHHLAWLKSVRKVLCKMQLYLGWLLHKTNSIYSEEAKSCQLLLLLDTRCLQASFTSRQESSCSGHRINTIKTWSLHSRLCSLIHDRVDVSEWTSGEWKETRRQIS